MGYSYPILNHREILECLNEMGIAVTESELLKPTADSIRVIYESLVLLMYDISREQLVQVKFINHAN